MTYVIRKIDNDLWRLMKAKAAMQGLSMKAVFEAMMEQYVQGQIVIKERGK